MKEERYFYAPEAATNSELPQEEAVHAIRVLRLKEGDRIYLMDGKGTFYLADVTMVTNKRLSYSIKDTLAQKPAWTRHIHIAVAPTKMMERIEWFTEKATEIGVDEVSFLHCQFSERRNMRQERIDKIVIAATKQSRKAWKPIVNEMQSFKDFINEPREGCKFICHCYNEIERQNLFDTLKQDKSLTPITVLIGPEGDFSIEEVRLAMQHGYKSVSLGSSRLRTETAALYAVMISQLSNK